MDWVTRPQAGSGPNRNPMSLALLAFGASRSSVRGFAYRFSGATR